MRQYHLILKFLEDRSGWPYTPNQIAKQTHIPQATVRKHLARFKKIGAVATNPLPTRKSHPEYYTNEILLKKYVDDLKKQRRRTQINTAQRFRRSKQ